MALRRWPNKSRQPLGEILFAQAFIRLAGGKGGGGRTWTDGIGMFGKESMKESLIK